MSCKNNTQSNKEQRVKFTPKRFLKMGFHVWRQFDDQYYAGFAAQIAYFFFMSSIPMLIVLSQVLGLFDVSMDFIKEWLTAHLSTQMNDFLLGLFDASSTAVINVLLIFLALWSSSSLVFSLSRLATYTLTRGKYRFTWMTERAKAIPVALFSLLIVALAAIIYVYGEMISLSVFNNTFAANLIISLRTPVLGLLFFFVILANFYIVPRIKVPIRALLPGAIMATIGILLVTWLYSLYISSAANYNLIYGTFSNIVAMLLWFYCISWVLCIGMMFNKSWDIHMKRGRLSKESLKEYVMSLYGEQGEEMWNKMYMADEDIYDKSLDSLAVKYSRKFDPGYEEKRQYEIKQLRRELELREELEEEMKKEFPDWEGRD